MGVMRAGSPGSRPERGKRAGARRKMNCRERAELSLQGTGDLKALPLNGGGRGGVPAGMEGKIRRNS